MATESHNASSIADAVRRSKSFDDAVKLVQLYGDLRVAEATPNILAEVFGSSAIKDVMHGH